MLPNGITFKGLEDRNKVELLRLCDEVSGVLLLFYYCHVLKLGRTLRSLNTPSPPIHHRNKVITQETLHD